MRFPHKAFTITEILVVVFIIGVIALIPVPLYLQHMQRAAAAEAVSTLALIREEMRDYHITHNSYPNIAAGHLEDYPPTGLGIQIGVAQYFSSAAYSVSATNLTSTRFTNPAAQDFIIAVDGSASVQCGNSNCALASNRVASYRLEMDNTNRIFVSYDAGKSWRQY